MLEYGLQAFIAGYVVVLVVTAVQRYRRRA